MEIIDKIFDSSLIVFLFFFFIIQIVSEKGLRDMGEHGRSFIAIPIIFSLLAMLATGIAKVWLK